MTKPILDTQTRARWSAALSKTRTRIARLLDGWYGADSPRPVTWLRTAGAAAVVGTWLLDPSDDWPVVHDPVLCALAVDLAGGLPLARDGWDSTWLVIDGESIEVTHQDTVVSTIACEGGQARLVKAIQAEMARQMPHVLLSKSLAPDLPRLVRRLTSTESRLEQRLAGYLDAGIHRSVLLYGPPGSAKTSAACSISSRLLGSYIRFHASHLTVETSDALCLLRPAAVVVDDIDRCGDVAEVLDLLQRLADTVPLVFATANVKGNIDAAGLAPHRLNLHVPIDGLDTEAHAELVAAAGLTGVNLGSEAPNLLAADILELGRRHRGGDLSDPIADVTEMLARRAEAPE